MNEAANRTLKGFQTQRIGGFQVCNPFRVTHWARLQPRVRSLRSRPWAKGGNPFGVHVREEFAAAKNLALCYWLIVIGRTIFFRGQLPAFIYRQMQPAQLEGHSND